MPILHLHILEGRSAEVRRDAVSRLTEATVVALDVAPEQVRVIIHEVPPENWGLAGNTVAARDRADERS